MMFVIKHHKMIPRVAIIPNNEHSLRFMNYLVGHEVVCCTDKPYRLRSLVIGNLGSTSCKNEYDPIRSQHGLDLDIYIYSSLEELERSGQKIHLIIQIPGNNGRMMIPMSLINVPRWETDGIDLEGLTHNLKAYLASPLETLSRILMEPLIDAKYLDILKEILDYISQINQNIREDIIGKLLYIVLKNVRKIVYIYDKGSISFCATFLDQMIPLLTNIHYEILYNFWTSMCILSYELERQIMAVILIPLLERYRLENYPERLFRMLDSNYYFYYDKNRSQLLYRKVDLVKQIMDHHYIRRTNPCFYLSIYFSTLEILTLRYLSSLPIWRTFRIQLLDFLGEEQTILIELFMASRYTDPHEKLGMALFNSLCFYQKYGERYRKNIEQLRRLNV